MCRASSPIRVQFSSNLKHVNVVLNFHCRRVKHSKALRRRSFFARQTGKSYINRVRRNRIGIYCSVCKKERRDAQCIHVKSNIWTIHKAAYLNCFTFTETDRSGFNFGKVQWRVRLNREFTHDNFLSMLGSTQI